MTCALVFRTEHKSTPAVFETFFRGSSSIISFMSWRQWKSSWLQRSYFHLEEGVDVAASAVHDDGAETDAETFGPEECSAEFFEFLVRLKVASSRRKTCAS